MVTTLLDPSASTIEAAIGLNPPMDLIEHYPRTFGRSSLWFVGAEFCSAAKMAYRDVAFKFEIFEINLGECKDLKTIPTRVVATLSDWRRIECLFRFNWERLAATGELPPACDPLVQDWGRLADVPAEFVNLGVSMVGLLFCNKGADEYVALVVGDDEDPISFFVSTDQRTISDRVSGYERVRLDQIDAWLLSTSARISTLQRKEVDRS